MNNTPEEIFKEYEEGIAFKESIGLFKTVNESERLFAGDQWAGLNASNMPKPVFNIIKRIVQYKVAAIKSNPTSIVISRDGINDGVPYKENTGELLTSLISDIWERLKMDAKNYSGLKDAALSGDYIMYFYWDSSIKTGQEFKGDINCEAVDNVNFFPGNPNSSDIQRQPYIILSFRESTKRLINEARSNNISEEEIAKIRPDNECWHQAGDISKNELSGSSKTLCLLKLYRDDSGDIRSVKVCRDAVIKNDSATGLTYYPIALMNWEERKNCVHGISEVYNLKPNQLYINKAFAQAMLNSMLFSFPKIIYDNSRIKKPSNTIGGAIAVNGNIEGAVKYLNPPSMSSDLFRLIDTTIAQTKELMGANDVSLGNIGTPNNTSAFIAVSDASALPLEGIRLRFYRMVEDMGRIILDFITSYYRKGRLIAHTSESEKSFITIDFSALKEKLINVRVDVGPSTQRTEAIAVNTLDKLLGAEKISLIQYLTRMPEGYIPAKQQLIEELKNSKGETYDE